MVSLISSKRVKKILSPRKVLKYLRDCSLIHSNGFWCFNDPILLDEEHVFDQGLSGGLADLFHDKSVYDFGCGIGQYVKAFRAHGIRCDGCDGNPYTSEITGGLCSALDLSKQISLGTRYDWTLSLEVGEHIPRKYEQVFINNVAYHATEGVVLSWSVEGQGGLGHVNERSNEYIEEQLASRAFIRDAVAELKLRQLATVPWFKQSLMVFRRRSTPS